MSVDNWEAKDGTKRKKVFVTGEKLQLLNSISEGKKLSEPVEEATDSFTF